MADKSAIRGGYQRATDLTLAGAVYRGDQSRMRIDSEHRGVSERMTIIPGKVNPYFHRIRIGHRGLDPVRFPRGDYLAPANASY
jgi:hypothetical protein